MARKRDQREGRDGVASAEDLPRTLAQMQERIARLEGQIFGERAVAANGETGESTTDGDAEKALERAKRFGTGQTAVGKLDEALPEEHERGSRKRGVEASASAPLSFASTSHRAALCVLHMQYGRRQ